MPHNYISEDDIERAVLRKLRQEYGFELLDCFTAKPDDLNDGSNRRDKRDVILADRLKAACLRLNPDVPETVIDGVAARVTDRRGAMSAIAANRELDDLIRDGAPVEYDDAEGRKQQRRVRLIDFDEFTAGAPEPGINPRSSLGAP